MKPSAVLKKAMKLIEDPKKWGKGSAVTRPGTLCAIQALWALPSYESLAEDLLREAFDGGIIGANDLPDTTHADVLTAYCFAIELAKDAERGSK